MSNNKKEEAELIEIDLKDFLSKNWNKIALALILFFALYLRIYHIDYPVIDYHNWKEIQHLTPARNFEREGFFKYGFFIQRMGYSTNMYKVQNGVFGDASVFDTLAIILAILFKIFGENLILARFVNILFGLASILLFYLITKLLTKNEEFALLSAAIFSITPLYVFFSRNIHIINVCLLCMLTSAYLFLRWLYSGKYRYLLYFSIFFTIGTISTFTFAIILVPLLFLFPVKKEILKLKQNRNVLLVYLITFLILLVIPVWTWYNAQMGSYYQGVSATSTALSAVSLFWKYFFSSNYFAIIYNYMLENYGFVGIVLGLLGIILLFTVKIKKLSKDFYKFAFGYFLITLLYFIFVAEKLRAHNYYQYPFAPFLIISLSYFIYLTSVFASKLLKSSISRYFFMALFIILYFYGAKPSIDAMFNTQFFGLDVAGEYIKEHSEPWERLFYSGHQSFGVLWYADRFGYPIKIPKPKDFEFAEKNNLNVSWLFIYQWGFEVMRYNESWSYIKNNFHPVQVAFIGKGDKTSLLYLLLKKGGNFNETSLNQKIQEKINRGEVKIKEYELTYGKVPMYYINLE